MPLNTSLQNISAAIDPGVKAPDTTNMSSFNMAYQYGQRAKEKRQEEGAALEGIKASLAQESSPKSVAQMLADFSTLPPEEMYKKIGSMAAIGITKPGQNIIDTLTHIADKKYGIEQQSIQKQTAVLMARKQAEFNAEMITGGYNPENPDSVSAFKQNKSFRSAAVAAKAADKSFDPSMLEPGWVDANGRINEQLLYSSIAKMPIAQSIESREIIAQMRVDAANNRATQGQAFAPSMFEREIIFREQRLGRKLTAEEFKVYDDLESGVRPKASVGLDRSVLKDKIDRKKELQKQMDGLRNLAKTTAENVAEMKQIRQSIQAIDSEIDAMVGSDSPASSNPRLEPLEGGKLRYVPK